MKITPFLVRAAACKLFALLLTHSALAAGILDAAPRNIQFSNLSPEEGLSSEFIHDVVQDGAGYIWFASQAGLNRYDGQTVRVYEHDADDPTSISHSFVWSLHVDPSGALWAGTNQGVSAYDPATDSFIRQPLGGAVAAMRVRKITMDRSGRFWIGSVDDGVVAVDPATGARIHFEHDPADPQSLPDNHIIDILEDRTGQLWIGTDGGGLAGFNKLEGAFVRYRNLATSEDSLSDDAVRSLYEDRAGQLWVGTAEGGLNRFNRETGTFERFQHDSKDPHSVGSGRVGAIFEDADGSLWVGTESGLSEWRPSIGGFVNYVSDAADRKSLINNNVRAMTQDASGVLWLATHGGVSAWNYVSDTFQHYDSAESFLQSDVVTSIAQTGDGIVWVGTYGGGLSQLDLATGGIRHFRHDPADATSLSDDRVMTVHADANDTVWVGTRSAGLCRLEPDGSFTRFVSDAADSNTLAGNSVSRIASTRDGSLWVGHYGAGLSRLQWQEGKPRFQRFAHDSNDSSTLSGNRILAIFQDASGELWIGAENAGLSRFIAASNSFQHFEIQTGNASSGNNAAPGTPWELRETADGTLWIGTLGLGLLRWSAADRAAGQPRFEQFGPAAGLTSDIYGILEGGAGELWLSSSRGLYRFDPALGNVRRFDRSNGLRNNEFNVGAARASDSGLLLFGGTSGLVTLHPDKLRHNLKPPAIDLVAKSRTATLLRNVQPSAEEIKLEYTDSFVAFEFVALDFVSPDKNSYRFRLNGYDADWNDAQGLRRAIYSSLPAGEYTFEVQASNSDGVWNRDGATMPVRVLPPPWRTAWAYALYTLVTAIALLLIVNAQKRKARLRVEQRVRLEELVRERTQALAERNDDLLLLNRRLKEASVTDQLTGLRNRRFVDQFIDAEVSAVRRRQIEATQPLLDGADRDSSKLLCLIMIDLDGFKLINDRHGHHAGDEALLEVKERLNQGCRTSDVVVRWGGDEFLIVARSASFEGIQLLAEKLRGLLADTPYLLSNGHQATLSGSIGISAIPFVEGRADMCGWGQVIAIADQGAYLAKTNGRNAWVSIRGTDLTQAADFKGMKENLPALVANGQLAVDSSVPGGISLDAREPVSRLSAG